MKKNYRDCVFSAFSGNIPSAPADKMVQNVNSAKYKHLKKLSKYYNFAK